MASGPRNLLIVVGVVVVVLGVALFFMLRPGADGNAAQPVTASAAYKDDHTLGNPNAPVVFLEYAAPGCPFCARFNNEAMPGIRKDYIDTGKVFYIFRTYPLQAADFAVEGIARCLPADHYFPYLDMMYRNQSKWDPDGYDIPDVHAAIVKLAAIEGLDPERVDQCINDRAQQDRINQIAQDGQLRYTIEGTPTFVINGQVVMIHFGENAGKVVRAKIDSFLPKK